MGGRWLVLGLIALRCGSAPPPVGLPGADTRACIRADMGVCIRADTRVCIRADTRACPYRRLGLPTPLGLPGADMGVCIRADTRVCPYEDDDAMNVIGHDDERVGLHARIKRRQFVPNFVHHFSRIVQPHFAAHYLSKQAGTVLGAKGNKIRPCLVVIVAF